jgi:cysteine desulfurase
MQAARKALMNCVCADAAIFTSGGTEAANMAVLQGWPKKGGRKMHFITSAYEHACVFEAFRSLEEAGHRVDYLRPGPEGRISPEALAGLVSEDTALVGIMHVNNELGTVNEVCALAKAVKDKNPSTLFFADGVQAFLRIPFDMSDSAVDYYSASAHKIHGLKGAGVLFHKKSVHPQPILIGGGQENALRSGTENTFGILAFARAAEEFLENHAAKLSHMKAVKERLREGLLKAPGAVVFSPKDSAPHILNIAFPGMGGEVLLHALEERDIFIATGAACSSKKKAYRVHEALGVPRELAQCAVRISFCPDNTEAEADVAIDAILAVLKKYQRFVRR